MALYPNLIGGGAHEAQVRAAIAAAARAAVPSWGYAVEFYATVKTSCVNP